MDKYIKKILEANVYDLAQQTPLHEASGLSARLGHHILLKREDLQPVFSFKLRGAFNMMRNLTPQQQARGVVTASAGNHAQGVAMAAGKLGIAAIIVMGRNTPDIKVDAVRRLGGKVILHGDNYNDASVHGHILARQKGLTYVHPFDDIDVIAGQGTIGVEILRQHTGKLDVVCVPVGGGGLIAGIGAYVKYLRPDVRVIGVEAEGSACLWAALQAGRRVKLRAAELDQFADGTSVAQVGKETFRIAKQSVDEVIKVSVDEICAAIKDIFEDTRSIAEPSGALSVAGLKQYLAPGNMPQKTCIAIVSGANMNFHRLRHVAERAEIGENREILLGVSIPEQPGSFKRFCQVIGKRNITEFNYRFSAGPNAKASAKASAKVLVGIQTSGDAADKQALIALLADKYALQDLSSNEVAVLHMRHMVGGRAEGIQNERIFRFEFPEQPGALMDFLNLLNDDLNISMFHYRNHGSAYGRVLAGIQITDKQTKVFKADMDVLGYRYWEETENPAYLMFLS